MVGRAGCRLRPRPKDWASLLLRIRHESSQERRFRSSQRHPLYGTQAQGDSPSNVSERPPTDGQRRPHARRTQSLHATRSPASAATPRGAAPHAGPRPRPPRPFPLIFAAALLSLTTEHREEVLPQRGTGEQRDDARRDPGPHGAHGKIGEPRRPSSRQSPPPTGLRRAATPPPAGRAGRGGFPHIAVWAPVLSYLCAQLLTARGVGRKKRPGSHRKR